MEALANDLTLELDDTIDDNDTSFDVVSATGVPPVPFRIRIEDEIMLVTNVSSLTFTVTRAYEDASRFPAASHAAGEAIHVVLTVGGIRDVGATTRRLIAQSSHGFSVGNLLYHSGSAYALADKDSASTAEAIGIVEVVLDANNYILATGGYVGTLSGLTAGTVYFVGDSGALTATEPSTVNQISKPVFVAVSTTAGYFINMRGSVVGGGAGSIVAVQTIFVPAAAMRPRTTNGAAVGATESSSNKVMMSLLDFDTTTQEFAQFQIAMPNSWDKGTVTAEFFWTAASSSGGVVWALEAVAISDDDVIDAAFGTAQQVADTLIATTDVHKTAATSPITIGGTPANGDLIVFQVKRVPSDGSDTLGADARLIGVKLTFSGVLSDA